MNILYVIHRYQVPGRVRSWAWNNQLWVCCRVRVLKIQLDLMIMFAIDTIFNSLSISLSLHVYIYIHMYAHWIIQVQLVVYVHHTHTCII
jgi:hypothetical protein